LLPAGLAARPRRGYLCVGVMPREPQVKRTIAFLDGQNLFRHAKTAFGHHHPNCDPRKLANAVCAAKGWTLAGIRFYTGVPSAEESPLWHDCWARRRTALHRSGITVISRPLRYRTRIIRDQGGTPHRVSVAQEKGIDLRLGLDVVRMARDGEFDVVLIFSQDQDLAEVAREIRKIAHDRGCWLKIASAFPDGPNASSKRGIGRTDWFRMDRQFYDACLDPKDYRTPRKRNPYSPTREPCGRMLDSVSRFVSLWWVDPMWARP